MSFVDMYTDSSDKSCDSTLLMDGFLEDTDFPYRGHQYDMQVGMEEFVGTMNFQCEETLDGGQDELMEGKACEGAAMERPPTNFRGSAVQLLEEEGEEEEQPFLPNRSPMMVSSSSSPAYHRRPSPRTACSPMTSSSPSMGLQPHFQYGGVPMLLGDEPDTLSVREVINESPSGSQEDASSQQEYQAQYLHCDQYHQEGYPDQTQAPVPAPTRHHHGRLQDRELKAEGNDVTDFMKASGLFQSHLSRSEAPENCVHLSMGERGCIKINIMS